MTPYIYREFSKIDKEHDWESIIDSSYEILNVCLSEAGIAMDWCKIDKRGKLVQDFSLSKNKKSNNYSFDALRSPFRVAMDYYLFKDERALIYLKSNKVFLDSWNKKEKIYARYDFNGKSIGENESLASYGSQLAGFSLIDKNVADQIFEKKIKTIDIENQKNFYDLYWIWSGVDFYSKYFDDYKIEEIRSQN